jgi:hypothetical protein
MRFAGIEGKRPGPIPENLPKTRPRLTQKGKRGAGGRVSIMEKRPATAIRPLHHPPGKGGPPGRGGLFPPSVGRATGMVGSEVGIYSGSHSYLIE